MVEKNSDIQGESFWPVAVGQGIYTSELPSNIPDGFCAKAYNLVATGDSLENRSGIKQSSVDWHFSMAGRMVDDNGLMVRSGDDTNAVIVWSSYDGVTSKLHLIRSELSPGGGDGYMEITMPAYVRGIATYQGIVYFTMADANRMYKIDTYNWVADSIGFVSIPSALGIPQTTGLYSFKDRLWTFNQSNLYFSDIAPLGGGPEGWAATSYVRLDAGKGKADIKKVVPLGNKLLIFTAGGVFTLLVEGEPSSWILKILDSESQSTSRNCAFEAKGIVYYVNTQGVWASNGSSVAKLSGVIEDQFFLAKGNRYHTIHSYEDGIILCVSKLAAAGHYDAPNCRIFYSKLDPVGWTEWNFENGDGTTNAFGANRIVDIHSVSAKLGTKLNPEPTVYFVASVTDSLEAAAQNTRVQLLIFDGGSNQARDRAGTLVTAPVNCVLKSKYMDAGNPFRLKSVKFGTIELYTSDSKHMFKTSWDLDATIGTTSEVETQESQDFVVGQASNLIKIRAGFPFRRCALTFASALQTETSQIKIKDIALVIVQNREEMERVR